jgi:uncharacterized membrane protein (UPF0136 family)
VETFAAIAYGLVALVGGIIGYLQARSQQSLISGTVSGILLLVAGIANALDQEWGTPLATIVTAVLIVVFVLRFQKTRKFMPAGLMVILGVLALLALVV